MGRLFGIPCSQWQPLYVTQPCQNITQFILNHVKWRIWHKQYDESQSGRFWCNPIWQIMTTISTFRASFEASYPVLLVRAECVRCPWLLAEIFCKIPKVKFVGIICLFPCHGLGVIIRTGSVLLKKVNYISDKYEKVQFSFCIVIYKHILLYII